MDVKHHNFSPCRSITNTNDTNPKLMFVFTLKRGKLKEFPYCLAKGNVYVTLHDEYITKGEKYIHHYPITTGAEELPLILFTILPAKIAACHLVLHE